MKLENKNKIYYGNPIIKFKEELISKLKSVGVELVDVSKLKPHEQVSDEDMNSLRNSLLKEDKCILKFPIVCEKEYNIIIDGHNRYHIFKELGLKKIPVYYVDYFDDRIVVDSWREGEKVTKRDVIEAAKSGKVFPPKTTKHLYIKKEIDTTTGEEKNQYVRILEILPQINVPIDALKNDGFKEKL